MAKPDDSDPAVPWLNSPVIIHFHDVWWKNRARKVGRSRQAFSQGWLEMLEATGLRGAEEMRDAMRDLRELERAGLIRITTERGRPEYPARIRLPVEEEMRFARLFGDPMEGDHAAFDFSAVDWEPELAFLRTERCLVAPDDLLVIQRFLREGGRSAPIVPIKERSLDLFGDEKRLDALSATSLFAEGRLTLEDIRARFVAEPLAWLPGPGRRGRYLIVENAATWDSFHRWNREHRTWCAVIYGAGHRVIEGIGYLKEIEETLGAVEQLDYFGDLDEEGLRIPMRTARRCRMVGLPAPEPLEWAYAWLLDHGRRAEAKTPRSGEPDVEWLPARLRPQAEQLLREGKRLAQENLGWAVLERFPGGE